jgi:transposase-like protein
MRWTPQRKAAVVEKVLRGVATAEQICAEHGIWPEELDSWLENYRVFGLGGLKASRVPPIRTTTARLRFRERIAPAA